MSSQLAISSSSSVTHPSTAQEAPEARRAMAARVSFASRPRREEFDEKRREGRGDSRYYFLWEKRQ